MGEQITKVGPTWVLLQSTAGNAAHATYAQLKSAASRGED